jgi:general secretion pathway protein G
MDNRKNRGFTLIELLLVVTIIGILAAIVVPRLVGRVPETMKKAAMASITNISKALEIYEMDNGMFPTTEQGLKALLDKPTSSPVPSNWLGPYLKIEAKDPWGKEFQYRCPPQQARDFDIWSLGPDGRDGSEDDIANWKK